MADVYRGLVTLSNPGSDKPWKAQRSDGSGAGFFEQAGQARAEIERPFGVKLRWERDADLAVSGVEGYKGFGRS